MNIWKRTFFWSNSYTQYHPNQETCQAEPLLIPNTWFLVKLEPLNRAQQAHLNSMPLFLNYFGLSHSLNFNMDWSYSNKIKNTDSGQGV